MKSNSVVIAVAFLLGVGVAMFFNRPVNVLPLARAADESSAKMTPFNPNAQYYTTSSDGMTVVVWCFESTGKNTSDYGPTLKWAKVYHPEPQK